MSRGNSLGIDVGGTKFLATCLDGEGKVLDEWSVTSPSTGDELVAAVADAAGQLCGGDPAALGVDVPGLVDALGTVRIAPNLRGITGMPLVTALAERFPAS